MPELCAQFRGFSRFFAPRSGLLLWRPAALTGSAFCELAFCGFEVDAVAIVAVVGDVLANDGKEPLSARKASALANAAESVPHDAWDAESG